MNSTNVRYRIYPQMKAYDNMPPGRYVPYVMLSGPSSFRSEIINTDSYGFRLTSFGDKFASFDDIEKYEEVNIFVGASTAFGVGASSDATTIPSYMSKIDGTVWLNLGNRGCNSLQEYLHLILFLQRIKKINRIIFFSGINDAYLALNSEGPSFYDSKFGITNSIAEYPPIKQIFVNSFSRLTGLRPDDLVNESVLNMFFSVFKKRPLNKSDSIRFSLGQKISQFERIYERNFSLYKGIVHSYDCKITFILQPFIYWTERRLSTNEERVMGYLSEIQKRDPWDKVKKDLSNKTVYDAFLNLIQKHASHNQINFFNSNVFLTDEDDYFVDAVHITDKANEIIAQKILSL